MLLLLVVVVVVLVMNDSDVFLTDGGC